MTVKNKMKVFALNVLLFIRKHIMLIISLAFMAAMYVFVSMKGEEDSDGLLDYFAKFGEIFGGAFTTDTSTDKKKGKKHK